MKRNHAIAVALVVVLLGGFLLRGPIARAIWGMPEGPAEFVEEEQVKSIDYRFDGPMKDGAPAPWTVRSIRGTEPTFDVVPTDKGAALHLHSEQSHYLLWSGAQQFDPKAYPVLRWSWNVKTLPTRGDVRTYAALPIIGDNRNDKAAQVLIGFEGNNVLMYVWDTVAPVGTEVEELSPVARVMTRVVESGDAKVGSWQSYQVNVYDDYVRRYGKPPTKVLGVSVQINSNHTGTVSDAMVREFRSTDR